MSHDPEPEIQDYLGRLAAAAHDLPETRRDELLGEIEQHIRQAVAEKPPADRDEMLALLAHVGDPAEIAAAAQDPADAPPPRRRRRRLRIALVVLAILIALAAGTAAFAQTYQPLAFAAADVLTPNSVNTYGEGGHGAWIGYHRGVGQRAYYHPFFGVAFQNTGHFTVRVLGLGEYAPLLPVLRGWDTQLLMARGRFVDRATRVPAVRTGKRSVEHGYVIQRRVWKRGPLQAFRPVDLAPGQIVMLVLWGHSSPNCHIRPYTGQTVPPQAFPVKYSFLWRTTTTHIALPSGLKVAATTRHPDANRHKLVSLKKG